jgi:hypothetical protein
MGAIPNLCLVATPQGDEDTVTALRSLLALAEAGQIRGVAYVALHTGNGYSGDVTGAALERPIYALGLAHILEDRLNQLIK